MDGSIMVTVKVEYFENKCLEREDEARANSLISNLVAISKHKDIYINFTPRLALI